MIKIPISMVKTTSFSTLWYITAKADSYALGGAVCFRDDYLLFRSLFVDHSPVWVPEQGVNVRVAEAECFVKAFRSQVVGRTSQNRWSSQ